MFKATYTRWLNTHERSHQDYHKRKSFPWHIISKLDFSPSLIQAETSVFNKDGTYLGIVYLDEYQHRSQDLRHQFDVTVKDSKTALTSRFRIVFSDEGVLITIHHLGKDHVTQMVKDFFSGNYESYANKPNKRIAKAILKEAVLHLLKNTHQTDLYAIDQPYPGTIISSNDEMIAATANRVLRQRTTYTVDLSQGRDVWMILSLFQYEAHAITYKYAPQCKKLVSLFLSDTKQIVHKNVFPNAIIISVYEYFDWSSQDNLTKHLEALASSISSFKKYT